MANARKLNKCITKTVTSVEGFLCGFWSKGILRLIPVFWGMVILGTSSLAVATYPAKNLRCSAIMADIEMFIGGPSAPFQITPKSSNAEEKRPVFTLKLPKDRFRIQFESPLGKTEIVDIGGNHRNAWWDQAYALRKNHGENIEVKADPKDHKLEMEMGELARKTFQRIYKDYEKYFSEQGKKEMELLPSFAKAPLDFSFVDYLNWDFKHMLLATRLGPDGKKESIATISLVKPSNKLKYNRQAYLDFLPIENMHYPLIARSNAPLQRGYIIGLIDKVTKGEPFGEITRYDHFGKVTEIETANLLLTTLQLAKSPPNPVKHLFLAAKSKQAKIYTRFYKFNDLGEINAKSDSVEHLLHMEVDGPAYRKFVESLQKKLGRPNETN